MAKRSLLSRCPSYTAALVWAAGVCSEQISTVFEYIVLKQSLQLNKQAKGKVVLLQAWTGCLGFWSLRVPVLSDSWHMNIVRLQVIRTVRLYPETNISATGSWGHSAARRIRSMKDLIDLIVNRTRDLPAFSAMPQPTAPADTKPTEMSIKDYKRRTSVDVLKFSKFHKICCVDEFCSQRWTL